MDNIGTFSDFSPGRLLNPFKVEALGKNPIRGYSATPIVHSRFLCRSGTDSSISPEILVLLLRTRTSLLAKLFSHQILALYTKN